MRYPKSVESKNPSHKHRAMSAYQVQDELPNPSLQKGNYIDDVDSGFHELIDDAATFELLSVTRRSTSPQSPLQNHVASFRTHLSNNGSAADSAYVTPEYSRSPVSPSPSPRILAGKESVSSSASTTSTQPDSGVVNGRATDAEPGETSGESSGTTFSCSPPTSPTGSEEDVSGKGDLYIRCMGARVTRINKSHRRFLIIGTGTRNSL